MKAYDRYIEDGGFSVLEEKEGQIKFLCADEAQTENVGEYLAGVLKRGAVVAMRGGMGAGKTALVRGFARGLGETGRVTSPTYTIVNEYMTAPPLFHFDLYRLESAEELYDIGFDDYLARGGICMIEWSENADGEVNFTHFIEINRAPENDGVRIITVREAEDKR